MVKVEGDYTEINRISTGLYSVDAALSFQNKMGLPLRTIVEIYGHEHIGKSTFAYYLSGMMNPTGRILICDFEGLDVNYLPVATEPSGFDGTIEILRAVDNKGKMRSHESMLNEFTTRMLRDEDVSAGVIDSIGAILPTFEQASEIGEGFGAKRAVVVAQLARKGTHAVINKPTPSNIFIINHSHTVVSGGMGHQSAGGVVLKHLGAVRLYLYFSSRDHIKSGDEILAHAVAGNVEKLRYGGKGKTFKFMLIPGYGLRPNLTAIQDCVDLGLAERGAVVKIEDKSFGYISKLVEDDLEGRDEKFEPFFELLKKKRIEV